MTRFKFITLALALAISSINALDMHAQTSGLYDFKVKDLSGRDFDFASLKGKKVLVVNTASKCGFTPQYEQLEQLYEKYKGKGLVVVGFPANNFGAQEPGTNEEIAQFCKLNYGVTFPMMAKISVKGQDMAPIYHYLTEKKQNGVLDSQVQWNFQKYLFDENGKLVAMFPSNVAPLDPEVLQWLD